MESLELSVILCSYNRSATLARCLEQFCRQTLSVDRWEVVLVNDGSTDDTHERVHQRQWPFQLRYIRQENTGLAGARNTAIQAARGRTLLLINDDTMARLDLLEKHLAAQQRHPHSMVLGSFDYEGWALESAFMQVVARSTVVFGYKDLTPGGKYDHMFSYTCNLSVPAEAYEQAGLFDTSFKSYGAEDTEMGYRLEKAGYRVIYCPEAQADHAHALTVDEFIKRQINVGSNFARYFRIHPELIRQPRWGRTCESSRFQIECRVEAQSQEIERTVQEIHRLEAAWKNADGKKRLELVNQIEPLVKLITGYFWTAGLAKGMQSEELDSFAQLPDRRLPMVPGAFSRELSSGLALSVIIPTYNRLPVLQQCLAALAAQTLAPDRFEVLVCDDGSSDGTPGFMAGFSAPFRVQYLRDQNRGPGVARNRGIAHAQGKIAVIMNDDTLLSPEALEQHLNCHMQWNGAPIAVMGAYWPSKDCVPTPLQCAVDELFFPRDELEPNRLHDFRALWTCNLSIALKTLRNAGGFDERFYMAASEDTDLGIRLAELYGCRILYRPDIIAFHQHQHSFDSFKRSCLLRGRMTYHLVAKHPWLIPQWFGITEFDGMGIAQFKARVTQLAEGIADAETKVQALEQLFEDAELRADLALGRRLALQIRPQLAKLHLYYNRLGTSLEIDKQQHSLDAQFADDVYYKGFPLRNSWANRVNFSIVVPADEESTGLKASLAGLRHQSYGSWEIILVDRSLRGTFRDVAKDAVQNSLRCHYVHYPSDDAPSAIRRGMEIAQGNLFMVLSPGIVLEKHFLHSVLQASQGSEAGLFCPQEIGMKPQVGSGASTLDSLGSLGGRVPSTLSVVRGVLWKRFYGQQICKEDWWSRLCARIANAGFPTKPVPHALFNNPLSRTATETTSIPVRSSLESLAMLLIAQNWRETVLAKLDKPSPELLSYLLQRARTAETCGDTALSARLGEMIRDVETVFPKSDKSQTPDLSVVIPTCDRKEKLLKCLQWLSRQSLPATQFEVVVVDDGSIDGTATAFRKQEYPFTLRFLTHAKGGPARARNRGIREARGEIIVLLGDDIEAPADFLKNHLRHHRLFPNTNEALLGHIAWGRELTITPFMEFITGASGAQFAFGAIRDENDVSFHHFYTSNLSLKKKFLNLEQPVFDEAFAYAAYEDTDLGYRLNRRGMRLRYRSDLVVYHDHPTDLDQFCQRQQRAGQMAVIFAAKHPETTIAFEISKYLRNTPELLDEVFNEEADRKLRTECTRLEQGTSGSGAARSERHAQLEKAQSQLLQRAYSRGVLVATRSTEQVRKAQVGFTSAHPDVAIIIPTLNRLELTRRCLQCIVKNTEVGQFEIIVVDNGSTDGTAEFLKAEQAAGHLRVLLNTENLGFAKACNQGTKTARGKHLLFLNNDTEVQPGWLPPLISLAEADPTIAAVGSKLLYPDGTIQHAGVAIGEMTGRDPLLAVHAYYKAAADLPEANERRVYQALTAACVLIRKSAFDAVGGFDEGFWNGYEDVDICLRLQENGGLMVYEPASIVVHHESQSGEQRYMKVQENIRRLHQKWLGKVCLDVMVAADGKMTPAESSRIRSYLPPPATASSLTSIIILAHNQLSTTRLCLESISRYTPEPHELILIDNGSTDGSLGYFRELAAKQENLTVIVNRTNRGFAAGNNQGLSIARGGVVMLLNNDTVVSPGWLKNMLAVLKKHPEAGLVGPVSNQVSGAQQVSPVNYQDLSQLPAFAERRAKAFARQSAPATRLVGFCLMARRAIIECIGGLDEQFGSGNFEDDDWCLRAAKAGFQARIALDSYVHHAGGQTFKGAGIDYRKAMQRNWELFKCKWGLPSELSLENGYPTPSRLPDGQSLTQDLPELSRTHKSSGAERVWDEALPMLQVAGTEKHLPACARVGSLEEARALYQKKDLAGSWQSVSRAITRRPFHPEAYLLLAEIAAAAGDAPSARGCAQHARELAPGWKAPRKFLKNTLHGNARPEWLVVPIECGTRNATSGTGNSKLVSRNSEPGPRLSVCLIVRNEERFLAQCLKSVRDLAYQVVVVDTGSTDRTVDIAKEHGAEVLSFAWCDDFSAARNFGLEQATGDWVLVLDADEELPADSHEALRKEMRASSVMAYRLPIADAGHENEGCNYVPRLFRNAPGLHFAGRIHEHAFESVEARRKEWTLENRLGTTRLLHHGYSKELSKDRGKIERNLRLLRLALQESPRDVNLHMNLGLELVRSGDSPAGLEEYLEAFRLASQSSSIAVSPELREALLTQVCTHSMAAKKYRDIVRILNSPLAKAGGLTASLHFGLGLAHFQLDQLEETIKEMQACLARRQQPTMTPVAKEILQGGPHHCLAQCFARLKRITHADESFRAALAEAPQSRDIRMDYARFLRDTGRPVDAFHQYTALVSENVQDIEAWRQGGELALTKVEFLEFADDWTSEAIKNLPSDPHIVALRAEVLMLRQDVAAAKELWRRVCAETAHPRHHAAWILCEALNSANPGAANAGPDEGLTSSAFVDWYRQLVSMGAAREIECLNARRDTLRRVLPTATRVLDAVVAEVHAG